MINNIIKNKLFLLVFILVLNVVFVVKANALSMYYYDRNDNFVYTEEFTISNIITSGGVYLLSGTSDIDIYLDNVQDDVILVLIDDVNCFVHTFYSFNSNATIYVTTGSMNENIQNTGNIHFYMHDLFNNKLIINKANAYIYNNNLPNGNIRDYISITNDEYIGSRLLNETSLNQYNETLSFDIIEVHKKNMINIKYLEVLDKKYDGTINAEINYEQIEGIDPNDEVNLTINAAFDNDEVGNNKKVELSYLLRGNDSFKYYVNNENIYYASILPNDEISDEDFITIDEDEEEKHENDNKQENINIDELNNTIDIIDNSDNQMNNFIEKEEIISIPNTIADKYIIKYVYCLLGIIVTYILIIKYYLSKNYCKNMKTTKSI